MVRPKRSETPVHRPKFDYELSDDENNKSLSKMKIVLKNGESSSRLRSKEGKSKYISFTILLLFMNCE